MTHSRSWTDNEKNWLSARLSEHARAEGPADAGPRPTCAHCGQALPRNGQRPRNGSRGVVNWAGLARVFEHDFGYLRSAAALRNCSMHLLKVGAPQQGHMLLGAAVEELNAEELLVQRNTSTEGFMLLSGEDETTVSGEDKTSTEGFMLLSGKDETTAWGVRPMCSYMSV